MGDEGAREGCRKLSRLVRFRHVGFLLRIFTGSFCSQISSNGLGLRHSGSNVIKE